MLFVVKYVLYAVVYFAFKILEKLASLLGAIHHAKSTGNLVKFNNDFQGVVQERRILWRHKANLAYATSPWDFISWPTGTTDERPLLRDNVSLYCVNEYEAWFVETPKDVDIYSSDTDPFLYISQFKWAQRLYVVPIDVLISLGDHVGQPQVPVILISSHGRCGSTLLTQVFETVPDVVTFAEPDVLTNVLWLKWQNKITTNQLQRIVSALMKILCKSMNERKVSLYCIKTRCSSVAIVDIIAEHVPAVKHIFLYRDCAKTVSSMERSFAQGLNVVEFWYKCFQSRIMRTLFPRVRCNEIMTIFFIFDMTNNRYNSLTEPEFMASLTPLGLWTINWSLACAEYLRLRNSGIDIKGVRYEDLISSTESVVKGLSQHTGIKFDPRVIIEQVMPKDSQRGSTLSQDSLNTFKKLIPDDKSKTEMQFICSQLGLPSIENKPLLEGTIAVNI